MALNSLTTLSILYATLSVIAAQTFTPPSTCLDGNPTTVFPQCNSLYSTLNLCDGPSVSSGLPYISCMCNQGLFNNYYECESEYRLCLGTNGEDLALENGLEVWHSICDSELTSSLTTPPVSAIVTSFNQDYCGTAAKACDSGLLSQSQCLASFTGSASAFSSCLCQPKLLSLAYTCQVLGNTSCQLVPGEVTNMGQYKLCTNILSVLGTSPASTYANTTSTTTLLPTSKTNVSTATIASSLGVSGPSQTSATTVIQTTLQGAPPSVPTASSTKSSLGIKISLELSRIICLVLYMILSIYL